MNQQKNKENVQCLNCHRADKDIIAFLKHQFGVEKVFVGFIDGKVIGVQISNEIDFTDTLVIADTIKHLGQEF